MDLAQQVLLGGGRAEVCFASKLRSDAVLVPPELGGGPGVLTGPLLFSEREEWEPRKNNALCWVFLVKECGETVGYGG